MKKASSILVAIALLALAACGSKGDNTTGTGGQTSTHTTTHGTGGSGFGGSGGAPMLVNCNPFTAAECDLANGQTCDFDGVAFSCFDPPNTGMLCGDCGSAAGHYCAVGLTCLDSDRCTRFCCNDADCGAGGTCDLTFLGDPNVGVCVGAAAGMTDGGAGGSAGTTEPACSAPSQPPSMGSCYKP